MANNYFFGLGAGLVIGSVILAIHACRQSLLTNRIASLKFPKDSVGELRQYQALQIIKTAGIWETLTSGFIEKAHAVLTNPNPKAQSILQGSDWHLKGTKRDPTFDPYLFLPTQ
jgi:hypothetical protein